MKKNTLITLLITLTLVNFSCSEDDSNNEQPDSEENSIIGRWKLIKYDDNGELFEANECEQKSIVEFKSDNTFTNIAVIDDEIDGNTCVFDGFGVSGTYVITNNTLVSTTNEVIAIPDDLNVPEFIEGAKGENDPQIISFEGDKLILSESIDDGGEVLSFKYTYEKTTNVFFNE